MRFADLASDSCETRKHSSRMRTARLLPLSPSMHCSGGGCTCPGGVPAGGCTCLGGVPAREEVYLSGGGLPAQGGTCPGTPPLWTDRHV